MCALPCTRYDSMILVCFLLLRKKHLLQKLQTLIWLQVSSDFPSTFHETLNFVIITFAASCFAIYSKREVFCTISFGLSFLSNEILCTCYFQSQTRELLPVTIYFFSSLFFPPTFDLTARAISFAVFASQAKMKLNVKTDSE